MGSRRNGRRLIAPTVVGALLVAALLTAAPRGAVDWRALRAITLESDDWGLAGFVPQAGAWDGLAREELQPGPFPPVYWQSTLEDSAMVGELAGVLAARHGRDGLPAVMQPNYVMSSLAWEDGQWRRYDLPSWAPAYARPGLWQAVTAACAAGVWHPEYHAVWHYDPQRRREATAASATAGAAAARGIMLFPGSERARELGPWRPRAELAQELDDGLRIFRQAFGRSPGSLIAPDYTWDARCEQLWASRDLHVIQAKREQRHPGLPRGLAGRALKVLERQWSLATRQDRQYLERNCRLEPVQSPEPEAVVRQCVQQTAAAWRRGQPAVVETHRVNFAHVEPEVVRSGREALAAYLDGVLALAGPGPLFLVDSELAALGRHGTSLREAGNAFIARNGTHARRVAALPQGGDGSMRTLILLDPGTHGAVPARGQ